MSTVTLKSVARSKYEAPDGKLDDYQIKAHLQILSDRWPDDRRLFARDGYVRLEDEKGNPIFEFRGIRTPDEDVEPDPLGEALNMDDGVYRP